MLGGSMSTGVLQEMQTMGRVLWKQVGCKSPNTYFVPPMGQGMF